MALQRVRLIRHVEGFVIAFPELKVGDEILVPVDRARQLADSGVVDLIEEKRDLEAAALREPRRRG
jgi:hypothetical protein